MREGRLINSTVSVYMNGRQSSVSGIFELILSTLNYQLSTFLNLTGTAKATAGEKETKLDAAFHATLK